MVAACTQTRESVPWARSGWEAQSPRRSPHQEGVTETSVSVEMGASKTVPPASTREETSSLQSKTDPRISDRCQRGKRDVNPVCMCNRFVQKGREVRPQQNATVLMKGPGGFFELPFEAVFGGPARNESRNYWIKREGAEPVIVPDIERFGEKDKTTGVQNWERRACRDRVGRPAAPNTSGKKNTDSSRSSHNQRRSINSPALGNDRAPVLRLPAAGPGTRNEFAERSDSQSDGEELRLFP